MNSVQKIGKKQRINDGTLWNKTWVLEDLPSENRVTPYKWVHKIKQNADGTVDKFNATLVIKGFSHQNGIDYDQTFSSVARTSTIQALLSVSEVGSNRCIYHFSLWRLARNHIYKTPDGYNDGAGNV